MNVPSASPVADSRSFISRLRNGDEIARIVTFIFAATVVLLTVLLVYELWIASSLPRQKFGLEFFITRLWDPIAEQFGALTFINGTVVTSAVALLIAIPLGIGAAIFLAELAPQKVSDPLQFFIDLLAAVPSVIYGVLGVFIVIPLMRSVLAPTLKATLGFLPLFNRRHRARHHGHSLHHLGLARGPAFRAARPARGRPGARFDALGSDLEG